MSGANGAGTATSPPPPTPAVSGRTAGGWSVLRRLAALVGLWWVLTGGDSGSWVLGVPAVAAATWVAGRLAGGRSVRLSWRGVARFAPFFFWESLRGGLDVAWRTLAPRLAVSPGFTRYRIGLSSAAARVFFANCVSLLPGTLAADILGDSLEVHRLSDAIDVETELAHLEQRVAAIFEPQGGPET